MNEEQIHGILSAALQPFIGRKNTPDTVREIQRTVERVSEKIILEYGIKTNIPIVYADGPYSLAVRFISHDISYENLEREAIFGSPPLLREQDWVDLLSRVFPHYGTRLQDYYSRFINSGRTR